VVHEEAAAFALDALDGEEAAEFEHHLTTCPGCGNELGELQTAAAALAFAAGLTAPSPALRLRVLDTGAPVIPLRRRWRPQLLVAASVAAACIVLVVGHRPWQQDTSMAGIRRYQASGGSATLLVDRSGEAMLAVRRLPPPRPGTAYEAWVIAEGRAAPAGLFRGSFVALTRPVPPGATVAVSVEPGTGSRRPTGRLLLRTRTT
jgi:hypothetical protein